MSPYAFILAAAALILAQEFPARADTNAAAALVVPGGGPSPFLRLVWNYPSNQFDTNLVFYVRSTTNAAEPLTNWPVLYVVDGTNRQRLVALEPAGNRFYTMTASNVTGESLFFSVPAVQPPAVTNVENLTLENP